MSKYSIPRMTINDLKPSVKEAVKKNIAKIPMVGLAKTHLSTKLKAIENEISESRSMLALPHSWDDEGALTISENTWNTAASFLTKYSKWIATHRVAVLSLPTISPVADGTIDILWHTKKARLLINVRNTTKSEIHYYGDKYQFGEFKGNLIFNGKVEEFFACWLLNLCD